MYLRLLHGWVRQEIFAIPGRTIALIFVAFLFLFPALTQETYFLRIVILACIFCIFAVSWDILSGVTGQLSLGHGVFFGMSAYGAAMFNLNLDWAPWASIPAGALVATVIGCIICLPALRLRGMYLGLVTLAIPIIITGVLYMFPQVTGGELGLFGLSRLAGTGSMQVIYYVVLLIFLVSSYIMYKVTDPKSKILRTGLILHAIREDEIAARMSGINTAHYKFFIFAVSAFFAGVAGGLYAHFLRIAGPSTLELFFSFQAILWCIFGGIATVYGGIVGVFTLFPMVEVLALSEFGEAFRFLIFAVLLILILFFMPEGLAVWILDKLEVKCPRCKLVNYFHRTQCRACRADLHIKSVDRTDR